MISMHRPAKHRPPIKHQSGAFDLPSVLIGVAVVAILAIGVMATIFGVIPWSQDRAAKQDLAAMNTAQGTAYARDGNFTDKAALVGSGWLGEGTPAALDAKADVEGKCYVAVTTSKTGNRFVISHNKPTPRALTSSDTWCTGAPILQDTAPVMVTTWDTSAAANCQQITLPVEDLKGTVTWGDGTTDDKITHAFTTSGQVTIRIDGTFTRWGAYPYEGGWADAGCLISVDRWGNTETAALAYAFKDATRLKHVESISPTATDLSYAFYNVTTPFTLGALDTSKVTTMNYMFYGAAAFNQPVNFNTSKVTTMGFMFYGADAFNQPLSLNTANLANTSYMFYGADAFNQPVNFNTSEVTSMNYMFHGATAFNQPLSFDTSKVAGMTDMFAYATAFNQPLNFNTSKVTRMDGMFRGTPRFDQPLNFDTSSVWTMDNMFNEAAKFNRDLSAWNVNSVTSYTDFSKSTPAWKLKKPVWVK